MIDFRKRGTLPISDSDAARIDRVASAVAKILFEQCETTSEALAVLAGASAATACGHPKKYETIKLPGPIGCMECDRERSQAELQQLREAWAELTNEGHTTLTRCDGGKNEYSKLTPENMGQIVRTIAMTANASSAFIGLWRKAKAKLQQLTMQREAGIATERADCEKALLALSVNGYPTPLEGYGTNSSWAISDLCRAVKEIAAERDQWRKKKLAKQAADQKTMERKP